MSKESPNYYAILTAEVRYDNRLSSSEKLFYAEITALTNKTGQCWASNSYFAKLYGVSTSTVSSWVRKLCALGYVDVSYKMKGKQIEKRYISVKSVGVHLFEGGYSENQRGGIQKTEGGYSENLKENNTSNNNTSNNTIYCFEEFWDDYDYKKDRKNAESKWKKISEEDRKLIKKFIPIYKKHQPDKKYRKHPTTFLNSEIWKDDWTHYKPKTTNSYDFTPEYLRYDDEKPTKGDQHVQAIREILHS